MLLAVIGKGGAGKTTITALLLRRLIQANEVPVLAVDADPSSCLGPALGSRVDATLGELRERVKDDSERPASVSKSEWLTLLAEEAISENTGFDLLTMGHPEGPGCYCFVNTILRDHLTRLSASYKHVLVDCEAGQEHLSRRTAKSPDGLVCVVGRSRMSAETIHRALALYEDLNDHLPARIELVMNGFDPEDRAAQELAELAGGGRFEFTHTWTVPFDPAVVECESSGISLLEIDPEAAAAAAFSGWEKTL